MKCSCFPVATILSLAMISPRLDKIRSLQQWVHDHGGSCQYLGFREFEDMGMGAVALCDFKQGEALFKVPFDLLLNARAARQSEIGHVFEGLPDRLVVYLFMVYERDKPTSKWRPYFDSLPEQIDIPMYYTDAELAELRGTNLLIGVESMKRKIRSFADEIIPQLCTKFPSVFPRPYTYEDLVWASSAYWSRCMVVEFEGSRLETLVPLADMLNHRFRTPVEWITSHDSASSSSPYYFSIVVNAPTGVSAGEQVFSNYGAKDNGELLMCYGFALQDNPMDTYFIELGVAFGGSALGSDVDTAEDPASVKTRILERRALERGYYLRRVDNGHGAAVLPAGLLETIRILVMTDAEVSTYIDGSETAEISPANELCALWTLRRLLTDRLARFPTTIEQDREMLASPERLRPISGEATSVSPNRLRQAVIYRLGQKEILFHALCEVDRLWAAFTERYHSVLEEISRNVHAAAAASEQRVVQGKVAIVADQQRVFAVANEPIEHDDIIAAVPIDDVLTAEAVFTRGGPFGETLRRVHGLDENVVLALFLLYVRFVGSSPEFSDPDVRHWSDLVSSIFHAAALMASPTPLGCASLAELKAALIEGPLFDAVREQRQHYQSVFAALQSAGVLQRLFPENCPVSLEVFRKAVALVDCASCDVTLADNAPPTCCLLPVAVSPLPTQHHPLAVLRREYDAANRRIVLRSANRYLSGARICEAKGDWQSIIMRFGAEALPSARLAPLVVAMTTSRTAAPSRELLMWLAEETFPIELAISPMDPLAEQRLAELRRRGLGLSHNLTLSAPVPQRLIKSLELCAANEDQLFRLQTDADESNLDGETPNQNTAAAWNTLSELLPLSFPTRKVEDDVAMLQRLADMADDSIVTLPATMKKKKPQKRTKRTASTIKGGSEETTVQVKAGLVRAAALHRVVMHTIAWRALEEAKRMSATFEQADEMNE